MLCSNSNLDGVGLRGVADRRERDGRGTGRHAIDDAVRADRRHGWGAGHGSPGLVIATGATHLHGGPCLLTDANAQRRRLGHEAGDYRLGGGLGDRLDLDGRGADILLRVHDE